MTGARLMVGERVLLTLWVGGLWSIGYIVAPALFANLEDRALAGSLAGILFHIIALVGLACGALLLLFNQLRAAGKRLNWRALVLIAMLVLVAVGEFWFAPMIAGLRSGGLVDSKQFAQLHGLAALLYLVTSLLGLLLVVARPDDG
jgi:hypothetical protein